MILEQITGTKQNEEFLDKRVMIIMRDSRNINGVFRSFDQFSNVTLENAMEIMFFEKTYSQKKLGLYIVRGESIVLIGIPKINFKNLVKVKWDEIIQKTKSNQHMIL